MTIYLRAFSHGGRHLNAKFATVRLIPKCTHIQLLHTGLCFHYSSKMQLSNLRKKTGFPISHCKKALQLHEGDLEKAEEWLQKEAEAHGWAKATKLSGRATTQGLIAVCIKKNVGCLVEVNCETDFVARNADFQALVAQVAHELVSSATSIPENIEHPIKELIDKEALSAMKTADGKCLSDAVALTIGKMGENIQLSRGVKFVCPPHLDLVGYAHPSPPEDANLLGRYGAVVAFKNASTGTGNGEAIRELCAHIVGMNPQSIGSVDDDVKEEKAEAEAESEAERPKGEVEGEEEEEEDVAPAEDQPLLRQTFLSDPEMTVGQVLAEHDIEIVDFVRLECGETMRAHN